MCAGQCLRTGSRETHPYCSHAVAGGRVVGDETRGTERVQTRTHTGAHTQ